MYKVAYRRLHVSKEVIYFLIVGILFFICGTLWAVLFKEISFGIEVMYRMMLSSLFSIDASPTDSMCCALTSAMIFLFYIAAVAFAAYAIVLKKTDDKINNGSHLRPTRF